jgi:triosephosphate isomerase
LALRRKLVVGNWKMNGNLAQLGELPAIAAAAKKSPGVDVAICPPFTLIAPARARSAGLPIGAQDCHGKESGACTGSVSAAMLKEAGRPPRHRRPFGAPRRASRVRRIRPQQGARGAPPGPAGDRLRRRKRCERPGGQGGRDRLRAARRLAPQGAEGEGELVVAYEPIWAIGTGNTATAADVAEMHAGIRAELGARSATAARPSASFTAARSRPTMPPNSSRCPDVDGALVGGASLTAKDFVPIIEAAAQAGRG